MNLYEMAMGSGDPEAWKGQERKSLCSGFSDADASAIIAWNKRMRELVQMDEIAKDIRSGKPARETRHLGSLTKIQKEWLEKRFSRADFSETMRLNYYLASLWTAPRGRNMVRPARKPFLIRFCRTPWSICSTNDSCLIAMDRHVVKLPLRVNWGGGWNAALDCAAKWAELS